MPLWVRHPPASLALYTRSPVFSERHPRLQLTGQHTGLGGTQRGKAGGGAHRVERPWRVLATALGHGWWFGRAAGHAGASEAGRPPRTRRAGAFARWRVGGLQGLGFTNG